MCVSTGCKCAKKRTEEKKDDKDRRRKWLLNIGG